MICVIIIADMGLKIYGYYSNYMRFFSDQYSTFAKSYAYNLFRMRELQDARADLVLTSTTRLAQVSSPSWLQLT